MTQPPPQPAAKPRHRLRRWSVRLLIGLLIVIGAVALIVQIVLWTSIPRDLVLDELQKQLGLRVSAKSLSTGWLGHSALTDVTMGLPLSDEAFLDIPRLNVSHTSLFGLVIGRPVEVYAVTMRAPVLVVRQDADGSWNLQQAAELVGRASGGTEAQKEQPATPPAARLPELTIESATLKVFDNQSRRATVEPIHVHGRPDSPLVYEYQLDIPDHIAVTGRIVPRGQWRHEVAFNVQDLQPWVDRWVADWPSPVTVEGAWTGQLTGDGVEGQLTLKQLQVQQYAARGVIDLHTAGADVTVQPQRLDIDIPQAGVQQARFIAGQIKTVGSAISLENLLLSVADGRVQLNGQLDPATMTAQLSAAWEQLNLPQGAAQEGRLEASLATPWPDQPQLDLQLTSRGQIAGGAFDTHLAVRGEGQSWSNIDWTLHLGRLIYSGGTDLRIRDLTAKVRQRGPEIYLDSVDLPPPGTVTGRGYINLATTFAPATAPATIPAATQPAATWYVWLDGADWQIPTVIGAPMRFVLNGWGDAHQVALEQLYVAFGDLQASINGTYVYDRPKPLELAFYLLNLPALAAPSPDEQPMRGKLSAEMHLAGTLRPRMLDLAGQLHGQEVVVMDRPLGDVSLLLSGHITPQRGSLRTQQLELLGGTWTFSAVYPNEPEVLRVGVSVKDLQVKEVGELLHLPGASGRFNGSWNLDMPHLDPARLHMVGDYNASEVRLDPLSADTIHGQMSLDQDTLTVTGRFRSGDGGADMKLSTLLSNPRQLTVSLEAASWPLSSGDGQLLLSANTSKLVVDLEALSARGTLGATVAAYYNEEPLGTLTLQSQLSGRQVKLDPLGGDLFGGTITGAFNLDLDRPLQTRGTLHWDSIQTARLGLVWPALEPLTGKFGGQIVIAPADEPRPLGPLRLTATVTAEEGRFNALRLGGIDAVGYASVGDGTIPAFERFVLDKARFSVADGTLNLWGRITRHRDGPLASQAILDLNYLDLDQLVHALKPESEPMPGRLGGRFTAVGSLGDFSRLYAEGMLGITESDLGNFGPVAALYNAMHLDIGAQEPTGEGQVQVRVEAGQIIIPRARYFNRGVEAVAAADIADISLGAESPVNATLVGSARPLKDIKLPFLADADQIFQAIQTGLTSIQITGTLDDIRWAVIPFQQVGEGIREILFGEATNK